MKLITRGPLVLLVLLVALVLGTVAACNVLLCGAVRVAVDTVSVLFAMLDGALAAAEEYWSKT